MSDHPMASSAYQRNGCHRRPISWRKSKYLSWLSIYSHEMHLYVAVAGSSLWLAMCVASMAVGWWRGFCLLAARRICRGQSTG
jgi:hypothetical protein